jgi:DNA mismatch repair ATPase MutL
MYNILFNKGDKMFNFINKIYKYNDLKKENELLREQLEKSIKHNLELETILSKIGNSLSKINNLFLIKNKETLKKEILYIEDLGNNLNEIFKFLEYPSFEEKIILAKKIESAIYDITRNYSNKDLNKIKKIIEDTKKYNR